MTWRVSRDALTIFLLALLGRLAAVTVTSMGPYNPYAQFDAKRFAEWAARIAQTLAGGSVPVINLDRIYQLWGALLSPFWLLPGPSWIYARVGVAVVGAVAVYNVYVMGRHLHSRQAGAVAVFPMLLFPSYLFVHSAVIREAAVLFGLTTAARLFLAPSNRLSPFSKYAAVVVALGLATELRNDNLPVYLVVLATGALLSVRPWERAPALSRLSGTVGVIVAPLIVYVKGQRVIEYLAWLRGVRARGRTEYLGWVTPETLTSALSFSWIAAGYFLFSPFPWMIENVQDLVVAVEALVTLGYAVASVSGVRVCLRETMPGTVALLVGLVLGSVLYGLGTANVGTAVRHRQMLVWVIFLFGAVGLVHTVRLRMDLGGTG